MVLRDLGLENTTRVVTPVAKRPKSEEFQLLAGAKTSERRGYHVVQVSHDAREQLVSGPSRLVIRCGLSGTGDEESQDERPRGARTCWALLARATSGAIVFKPQTLLRVLDFFFDADHAGARCKAPERCAVATLNTTDLGIRE